MDNFPKQLKLTALIMFLFIVAFSHTLALQQNYYSYSCPNAENIVKQIVQQRFKADRSVAAALLRMHFHDCFVRGCDASILIDSTTNNQAEKDAGANGSVREYALIDQIKAALERACPKTVSCADIITLATRDAVALSGGPVYSVPTGRLDGLISRASEVNLPSPSFTVAQARQSFSARGLTLNDMVVLLGGGHTIGVAHCNFFQNRVTNFQNTGAPDRTMDKTLASKLRKLCASNPNANPSTFLDQNTSFVFDNEYYNQIKKNKGILQIDQELALDPLSSSMVSSIATNNNQFRKSFVNAIIKMGNIKGSGGGEIRKNCRRKN
ncbi:peroxidase 44-like [Amaranthus tricolor]|uniref:peroxidase 44-like n=1 Tax=Amaranthus tricolor TaxID=29722 RepID=UPI002588417D|nr:peroxidase 44-like [Amaranthus tricolor]